MKLLRNSVGVLLAASIIVACGGSNNSETAVTQEKNTTIVTEVADLSTGTVADPNFVYYDLDTESELTLTEAEAETNSEWDIAFKRTKVYLNRNAAVPVSLVFMENTDEFYDETGEPIVDRFINATADTELGAFIALDPSIPEDAEFNTDTGEAAIEGWYSYNSTTHEVSADGETLFIVESNDAYTKFNVTGLVQSGFGMSAITFGIQYQSMDSETFATEQSLTVDSSSCDEAIYIDFDTLAEVTESDAWELSLLCTDGLIDFDITIADDARAINDPAYVDIDGVTEEAAPYYPWVPNIDVTFSFTEYGDDRSVYGWGDYGINGGHLLWSNFSSYIIKTESAYYSFQITSYYDSASSASGSYSFRYIELESESEVQ